MYSLPPPKDDRLVSNGQEIMDCLKLVRDAWRSKPDKNGSTFISVLLTPKQLNRFDRLIENIES